MHSPLTAFLTFNPLFYLIFVFIFMCLSSFKLMTKEDAAQIGISSSSSIQRRRGSSCFWAECPLSINKRMVIEQVFFISLFCWYAWIFIVLFTLLPNFLFIFTLYYIQLLDNVFYTAFSIFLMQVLSISPRDPIWDEREVAGSQSATSFASLSHPFHDWILHWGCARRPRTAYAWERSLYSARVSTPLFTGLFNDFANDYSQLAMYPRQLHFHVHKFTCMYMHM